MAIYFKRGKGFYQWVADSRSFTEDDCWACTKTHLDEAFTSECLLLVPLVLLFLFVSFSFKLSTFFFFKKIILYISTFGGLKCSESEISDPTSLFQSIKEYNNFRSLKKTVLIVIAFNLNQVEITVFYFSVFPWKYHLVKLVFIY